jgi:four helix bundle protein
MTNQSQSSNNKTEFNLEERTANFGLEILRYCKTLTLTLINKPLINQLVRSGTSVGANYMEANGADSKKDFKAKIGICKKEAKETMHWLRMLSETNPEKNSASRKLWKEAHELSLIFGAINRKL